jgi:hypothetical protein
VLAALPSPGELRAVFAQRVLGDAHGLDADRPVNRLASGAVRALTGRADTRQAWEDLGISPSGLASTVLGLGIPAITGHHQESAPDSDALGGVAIPGSATTRDLAVRSATAAALAAARAVPMALALTLDQVTSGAVSPVGPGGTVFVCENPSVIARAAAALRELSGDPPRPPVPATRAAAATSHKARKPGGELPSVCLICISGQPSVAARALIAGAAGGAEVLYHGDFDWAGLRIATVLGRGSAWTPWRFRAPDYEAALASAAGAPSSVPLRGPAAESPWDPELAAAMRGAGVAIEEEAVTDLLIADVVNAWPPPATWV